jgi:hypothetical protein
MKSYTKAKKKRAKKPYPAKKGKRTFGELAGDAPYRPA